MCHEPEHFGSHSTHSGCLLPEQPVRVLGLDMHDAVPLAVVATLRLQSRSLFLIDSPGSHTMVWPPGHAQASTAGRLPSSVTVDRVADIPGGRYHTQRPSVGGGQHEVSEKRIIAAIDCMLGWKSISTRFLARCLTNQGLIDALGVGIDHGERGGGTICPGWDAHTPLKSALPSGADTALSDRWGRVRYK